MVIKRSPLRFLGRRAIAVAVTSVAAMAAAPAIADAAVESTDCDADGQWFNTDTWYSAQTSATWFVDLVKLTLEDNDSDENNALYHVRGAANDRTYFSWRSGDNFPGSRTVTVQVDTLAPRVQNIYVQGWMNADQTVDSQCWTPRGYLG